jgi:hypothetical protein
MLPPSSGYLHFNLEMEAARSFKTFDILPQHLHSTTIQKASSRNGVLMKIYKPKIVCNLAHGKEF